MINPGVWISQYKTAAAATHSVKRRLTEFHGWVVHTNKGKRKRVERERERERDPYNSVN